MSDKTMHFSAYLLLVFLWWTGISPYKRVNWRKTAVWWTLAVMVWYGAMDEYLQGYVGRMVDVKDFYANLFGTITALALLTAFSFWPALLILAASLILIIAAPSRVPLADEFPAVSATFHLFAYAAFTFLWLEYIKRRFSLIPPATKWLIAAAVLPILLLITQQTLWHTISTGLHHIDILSAIAAIVTVVITCLTVEQIRKAKTTESSCLQPGDF
ncbi:MAG: VanZ family protein [Planctomycetota bacterium]